MTIEKFREEMRLLGLKPGDAIVISYWGRGEKVARGDFVRVNREYPQRIEWMDYDDPSMEKRSEPRLRSLCHRNIRRIDRFDWTNGLPSCEESIKPLSLLDELK